MVVVEVEVQVVVWVIVAAEVRVERKTARLIEVRMVR
jgi:hypothetical protein